jgi:hypothetical protein
MLDLRLIDSKLRRVIDDLNKADCITQFCCAGHKVHGEMQNGYILFERGSDKSIISGTLDKYKIKVLGFYELPDRIEYEFEGLGGSRGYQDVSLSLEHGVLLCESEKHDMRLLFSRNLSRLGLHHFSRAHSLANYALMTTLECREIPRKSRKVSMERDANG